MSVKILKRRIYSQGLNAARAIKLSKDNYVCPLCLKHFGFASLESGGLTLEHVPARSQGGKGIILTCRSCNNTAGHALEAQSHLRSKQESFARAMLRSEVGSGGRAYATLGDVRLNIEVLQEEETVTLRVSKYNDPAAIAAGLEFFRSASKGENWRNRKFNVTSRDVYHQRSAHVADLKAAFLVMVAAFGYSYAVNDVLEPVRDQIFEPEARILPDWWNKAKVPPNSIIIVEDEGLAVVSFNENNVVLPWLSRLDDNWTSFILGASKNIEGLIWPWPTEFSAHLDHQALD